MLLGCVYYVSAYKLPNQIKPWTRCVYTAGSIRNRYGTTRHNTHMRLSC